MTDFLLPSLGADMEQGQLVGWLVKAGDAVHRGQVIAEVETDKGVIEVECWYDGVVEELLVEPGPEKLPVGTPLARISTSEGTAEPVRESASRAAPAAESAAPVVNAPARLSPGAHERARASPRARALAEQLGVDLAAVSPRAVGEMITAEDVQGAAGRAAEPEDRATAMRRAIARSMAHSKREIPHYYLASQVDLQRAMAWLGEYNEGCGVAERILPAALLLKATALALRRHPDLNGHWADGGFQPSSAIHLGIAVSLRAGGLVAPALHDADTLDLPELMKRLRDVVNRARSWKLRSSEVSDPTITVTNLGERGVETAFPVIIPPQVAIIGFGRIVPTPVAEEGSVVVHPVVHATLAADHRVTDGHRGALFLNTLDRLLQEPESL